MKIIIKIFASCLFLSGMVLNLFAQEEAQIKNMIAELERNNTHLQAIQHAVNAEKAGNRIGLNPDDPQIGINYLKPHPRLADHRLDYSITQELEFPTVYGWRKKVAQGKDAVLDQQLLMSRSEVVGLTLQNWLQWVYHREYQQLLKVQSQHATQLAEAYQRAFEAGSISVLDRNKARIHAANLQKSFELQGIELSASWNQLIRLNGGQAFSQLPTHYPDWVLPISFEVWISEISKKPAALQAMHAQLDVHKDEQRLAAAMRLPHLSVGYMREQDIEVDFRGVTFGLSLPLWQNKNRSKHARLQSQAQESMLIDAQSQFEMEQQHLLQKAQLLQKHSLELRQLLNDSTEPALLQKALELGEITLVEYLVEQSLYYELNEKLLNTELDYYQTLAQMWQWLY
ncbi:MAG TPA: TolC family protein [Sphingobacteriaceae bacterium]|nr:TolC family protein [Sphingobacteriaceae bacterium]